MKWFWFAVHNCVVHPMMPFAFGRLMGIVDRAHDWTAKRM